jgi:outer membrane protein TolC
MSLKRTAIAFGLAALLVPLVGFGQTPPAAQAQAAQPETGKSLSLSLEDCIVRALKNNLAIQVAEYSPELAQETVAGARAQYMPTMLFNYRPSRSENATYSWLDTAGSSVFTDSQTYSGSFSELTPLGGTLSISLSGSRTHTNQRAVQIDPRYTASLQFSYSQPVLRSFGPKVTNRNIVIAANSLESSEISFYKTVQDTIYSVIQAYWGLVYSIENLKVQQLGLQLSKDLLAKNQLSVEIGTMSPLDLLTAQADVASREAGILSAEASVKSSEDTMKTLINLSAEEEKGLRDLVTLDKPQFEEFKANLDQALMIAMEKRPDLKISRLNLKNTGVSLSYAKNQLLPDLRLNASWTSPGQAGTQLIYDQSGALGGVVIGQIVGLGSQAWKDAFNFKYSNWSVGLTLNVNLSDYLTRASYAQAKINMDQALASMKQQEQTVVMEIRNAVRTLETSFKQVQAYKLASNLSEQKYNAEQEKLRVGQSTNYTVLQYLRDLLSARVLELNAIISYNVAQAGLDKSMGVLLEKRNIKVADVFRNN